MSPYCRLICLSQSPRAQRFAHRTIDGHPYEENRPVNRWCYHPAGAPDACHIHGFICMYIQPVANEIVFLLDVACTREFRRKPCGLLYFVFRLKVHPVTVPRFETRHLYQLGTRQGSKLQHERVCADVDRTPCHVENAFARRFMLGGTPHAIFDSASRASARFASEPPPSSV